MQADVLYMHVSISGIEMGMMFLKYVSSGSMRLT